MANSMTEHSKKLRAKTAAEYNRRMIAEGKKKQFSVLLDSDVANELTVILQELGDTRANAIKRLCEIYHQVVKEQ